MPPRKVAKVSPPRIPVVVSAVEVTTSERAAAVGLLAFGAVPLVITWVRLLKEQSDMSTWITLTILGLYSFALIETISLILLKGFRRIDLSDATMHWLSGMALAEVAPMAWYIIKKIL
jgi:hypothetical protein